MDRLIVVGVCCLCSFTSLAAVAQEKPAKMKFAQKTVTQNGIEMFACLSAENTAGSAVNLNLAVENKSKEKAEFFSRGKYWDYDLKVLDSKGRPVPLTLFGKVAYGDARTIGGSGLEEALAPGKQMKETLNIARVFDLSQEGEYTLTVRMRIGKSDLKIENMTFKVKEEPR